MKKTGLTKKLLSIVLAMMFLFSAFSATGCETAKAEENEYEIAPCFTTIMTAAYAITIDGITAHVSGSLTPKYKTSLSITLDLQKYSSGSWSTVKTWTASANDIHLTLEGSKVINIFSDYRLKATFKADQETVIRYRYPD